MKKDEDKKSALDVPDACVQTEGISSGEVSAASAEGVVDSNPQGNVWNHLSSEDVPRFSWRDFFNGSIFSSKVVKKNIFFILFIVFLIILYITNRYASQQEIIEEEKLRKELIETKNYALTRCAELTVALRQSSIEKRLKVFNDTTLKAPIMPPYVISGQ